eukprot:gene11185-biopygen299
MQGKYKNAALQAPQKMELIKCGAAGAATVKQRRRRRRRSHTMKKTPVWRDQEMIWEGATDTLVNPTWKMEDSLPHCGREIRALYSFRAAGGRRCALRPGLLAQGGRARAAAGQFPVERRRRAVGQG